MSEFRPFFFWYAYHEQTSGTIDFGFGCTVLGLVIITVKPEIPQFFCVCA